MASLHAALVMLVVVTLGTYSLRAETEDTVSKPETQLNNDNSRIVKQSEAIENQRTKRQYYYPSWTSDATIKVPIVSNTLWQPQYYQIRRPYFIPVWGSAGRIPIYLPPQPLNPGYPGDNPPKRFQGLPYLPPTNTEPPGTNDTTTKDTDTKFGDGLPVWDHVSTKSPSVGPTRPTRKPGQRPVTHPPLVHKDVPTVPDTVEKSAVAPIGSFRPSGGSSRPQVQTQPPKETPVLTNQPSRCVWAIISCCSANSKDVSYSCFEQLGCIGAFWDSSPCESEFARSAISAAMNYYNAN